MSTIMDILGQFEKLAYSLAIWIILIPKTIIKILIDPGWVRDYVAGEFAKDNESRFDDYVSPVILLLLCSLVPFVGYSLLPPFGMISYSDGDYILGSKVGVIGQSYDFSVEANYLDDTTNDYTIAWQFRDSIDVEVPRIVGEDQNPNSYGLKNTTTYTWDEPGTKYIFVEIKNTGGNVINNASSYITLSEAQGAETAAPGSENTTDSPQEIKDFLEELQNNYYLGILFLIPALSFSLAAHGIREKLVSAESLKEVFYAQCYYFTPFSLFFYVFLYGVYYATDDLWGFTLFNMLAVLGIIVWFTKAEISAIAQERGLTERKKARGIFFNTVILMAFVSIFLLVLISYPDWLRVLSFYVFLIGIVLLLLLPKLRRFRNWWNDRKKRKNTEAGIQ